jgi:hypothetical protein
MNYVCLDRRFASYERAQISEPLPYGPLSYWLDPALYQSAQIYFVNFVTDDARDAGEIGYLTSHDYNYINTTKFTYQFVAPNIITVDLGHRVIYGQIDVNKTTAITYNAGVDGNNRMIYPINIQTATYANHTITLTIRQVNPSPLAGALSLQWIVSQSKYRTDSVYVALPRIKKIKLADFIFCDWLLDTIPASGARYTLLINEYASDSFHAAAGNYHFIFNTQAIQAPNINDTYRAPYTAAHLEGNRYADSGFIYDNIGEYVFNSPVDIKDTITVTLGIMGAPLALKSGFDIQNMTFWASVNNYNSNFQVWIKSDLMRQIVNGLLTSGQVQSVLYITELTTSQPELDARAIRYATSPNGFVFMTKTQEINYGLPQRADPAGCQSPFGYMAALAPKSGEEYPPFPVRELCGRVLTCRASFGLLNFRAELILCAS